MIHIDNETGRMVNINAPYKGFSRLETPEQLAAAGVVAIAEDAQPVDYDSELYSRKEDWEATKRPYIIYERKSEAEVQAIMVRRFVANMEAHYDQVAQAKKYDNRLTCTLRAGYAGPFQAEGTAFALWMDACNAYGYTEMEKVMTGQRPMPTVDELIAELPVPPWAIPAV